MKIHPVPPETQLQIIRTFLTDPDSSVTTISEQTNTSAGRVRKVLHSCGISAQRATRGITREDEDKLIRLVTEQPDMPLNELAAAFSVSTDVIRNALVRRKAFARKPKCRHTFREISFVPETEQTQMMNLLEAGVAADTLQKQFNVAASQIEELGRLNGINPESKPRLPISGSGLTEQERKILHNWDRKLSSSQIAEKLSMSRFQVASLLVHWREPDDRLRKMVLSVLRAYRGKISFEEAQTLRKIRLAKYYRQDGLKGKCEICSQHKPLCLDHEHETGVFRGLLCTACNTAIGLLRDSPESAENVQKYLKRHAAVCR